MYMYMYLASTKLIMGESRVENTQVIIQEPPTSGG